MKKLIVIFLMLIFVALFGCSCQGIIIDNKHEVELNIVSQPSKLMYYEHEELDFSDLEVEVVYNNGERRLLSNYEIYYDELVKGTNYIYIGYKELETFFQIEIVNKEKMQLATYSDYSNKTIISIDYQNYERKFSNVNYGQNRGTNMFIVYDETSYIETNVYGLEAATDEYGQVVEIGTKVSLREGGLILSAHGTRKADISLLEIGDYVLFINNIIYVYKDEETIKYNKVFMKFYEYLDYINSIEDIDLYNEKVTLINNLIPKLEQFYTSYDDELEEELLSILTINKKEDIYNYSHMYSYLDLNYEELDVIKNEHFEYQLVSTYEEQLYVGGFRNYDYLVYYDQDNLRNRNNTGYEVGVDKNGIVVSKDILVELEEGGYILSGHTSAASFLIENVQLFDKIEIIDGKVYIYRDIIYMLNNYYTSLRNELVKTINNELDHEIPHDYEYINEIITQIDSTLSILNKDDFSFSKFLKISKSLSHLDELIAIGYSQLIEYSPYNTQGIWYNPFSKTNLYDDTSKEGIIKTLNNFKLMGINEIIISPFYQDYCLFDSSIFMKYEQLEEYNYDEYGHDYLKCFIEEAHKRNISVTAFTQTFSEHISSMKNANEEYYQINYQGEKSKGNIYYYDICNDNLQEELLIWYEELVTKYNFDKIEYDIIRYPSSNLYQFLDVDVISDHIAINDHGYTTYSMNKFMSINNLSGDLKELIRNNQEVRQKWLEFKEQSLIDFITNCTTRMKELNPNIIITAAVFGDYSIAKNVYLQDYRKWLNLSIVDELEVMTYTFSSQKVTDTISELNDLYQNYNIRIGISPRLDGADLITDIKQIFLTSRAKGYVIYSAALYYDETFKNILVFNHHQDMLASCESNDEINQVIINDVVNMIKYFYSVKNDYSYDELISKLLERNGYLEIINNLSDSFMKEYLLMKLT